MRSPLAAFWHSYRGARLCDRLGHRPAAPLVHAGNELLVDDLVRNGDPDGRLEPTGYVYFGCPRCGVNLEGIGEGRRVFSVS
jgi:hypothetical protein